MARRQQQGIRRRGELGIAARTAGTAISAGCAATGISTAITVGATASLWWLSSVTKRRR